MMLYAKIRLKYGSCYIQPLDILNVLIDEIQEAAKCEDTKEEWTIRLVEMKPSEYEALDEFVGH